MNFSIVIPQIFFDFIARVIPGLIFILLLSLGFPALGIDIFRNETSCAGNFIDSLGQGVGYATLSYFLGWLFSALTLASKQNKIREHYEKKDNNKKQLNDKYQWIRLSHPEAGYRIVKLRAEARMLEATRTAMLIIIIISILYLLFFTFLDNTILVSWSRSVTVIILAAISASSFRRLETKLWVYYWGNIDIVYKILHDKIDPVKDTAKLPHPEAKMD